MVFGCHAKYFICNPYQGYYYYSRFIDEETETSIICSIISQKHIPIKS